VNQWPSIDSESAKLLERFRYESEIRQLLQYRHQFGLVGFRAYFANPKFNKRRHTLTADLWDQWSKGNRGQKGMWL